MPRTLLTVLSLLLLAACSTTAEVEGQQTRVNVWLTVPSLAENGGRIEALVYVGPYKVVEGPVDFPKGTPTVNLPPLFIGAGSREVSAVLGGGRFSARESVSIERESWIQIVLTGNSVRIDFDDEQPNPWGE
ncbi:MAG: hypothetical protein QNJ90_14135 [Planctomycetota bacterium]|nr:hypothetical protein [Planctomycetota bacterium]